MRTMPKAFAPQATTYLPPPAPLEALRNDAPVMITPPVSHKMPTTRPWRGELGELEDRRQRGQANGDQEWLRVGRAATDLPHPADERAEAGGEDDRVAELEALAPRQDAHREHQLARDHEGQLDAEEDRQR